RIVVDSKARIPIESKMLHDSEAPVWVAVTENAPAERIEAIKSTGAEVIVCGNEDTVNLKVLLEQIGERRITSLLVEGGGQVAYSFLRDGLVDKVEAFIAPKLIGGKDAKTPVEGEGFSTLKDAVELEQMTYQTIGSDILVTGYVRK
nr:dihydrofolate reductase family protein [Schwartzia sp. (in: firmicutes)]